MLISGDTTTISAAEALLQAAPTSPEESWDNAHTLWPRGHWTVAWILTRALEKGH